MLSERPLCENRCRTQSVFELSARLQVSSHALQRRCWHRWCAPLRPSAIGPYMVASRPRCALEWAMPPATNLCMCMRDEALVPCYRVWGVRPSTYTLCTHVSYWCSYTSPTQETTSRPIHGRDLPFALRSHGGGLRRFFSDFLARRSSDRRAFRPMPTRQHISPPPRRACCGFRICSLCEAFLRLS